MIDDAPYAAWAIAHAPALAKEVLGEAFVARSVARTVRRTIEERTDRDGLERYRRACPVPGVGATRALCDAFAVFAPRATWWWMDGEADVGAPAIADQRLLIGAIADLTRVPVAPADAPFALRRDDRGSTYDAYAAMFAAFVDAHPEWRGRLERTARDAYVACAEVGGLFVVEVEGRVAGVFAARPDEVRGVPGWVVEEELLAAELRGRGLAPLVQRMALARLDAREHPLVLGTIDAANEPSWRTARRVGCTDVGGWVFVPDPRGSTHGAVGVPTDAHVPDL